MRTCKQCGADKPVDQFYARLNQPCKECHRANAKENRDGRIDEAREYDRRRGSAPHRVEARARYMSTPQGRARANEAKKRYIERNKDRRAAHIALLNAVRDGRLVQKPCVVCDAPQSQGHHFDYSRPLDVIWLCSHHHAAFHKVEREIERQQRKAA